MLAKLIQTLPPESLSRLSIFAALMNVHPDFLNIKKTRIDITLVNYLNRIFREFV